MELGVTVKVSCAPALVASVPTFQYDPLTEPCVALDETKVTPDGRVSDTCTLVEGEGP